MRWLQEDDFLIVALLCPQPLLSNNSHLNSLAHLSLGQQDCNVLKDPPLPGISNNLMFRTLFWNTTDSCSLLAIMGIMVVSVWLEDFRNIYQHGNRVCDLLSPGSVVIILSLRPRKKSNLAVWLRAVVHSNWLLRTMMPQDVAKMWPQLLPLFSTGK